MSSFFFLESSGEQTLNIRPLKKKKTLKIRKLWVQIHAQEYQMYFRFLPSKLYLGTILMSFYCVLCKKNISYHCSNFFLSF